MARTVTPLVREQTVQRYEQNVGVVFNPDARQIIFSPDNALAVPMAPAVAPAIVAK